MLKRLRKMWAVGDTSERFSLLFVGAWIGLVVIYPLTIWVYEELKAGHDTRIGTLVVAYLVMRKLLTKIWGSTPAPTIWRLIGRVGIVASGLLMIDYLNVYKLVESVLDSPSFGYFILYIVSIGVAYQYGIQAEKDRTNVLAQQRQEHIEAAREAARTPEERAAIERTRIRDKVINGLPIEEKVMFIVPGSPTDPKMIELEARVEKEVERNLNGGAEAL